MFIERDYQTKCEVEIFKAWQTFQSTLVEMATGCGKTIIFAKVIKTLSPKRALVLAHRNELIVQAKEKIEAVTGLSCQIEKADQYASTSVFDRSPVVVSSIQSQVSGDAMHRRYMRFKPEDFGVVIADECHHATSNSWREILGYYLRNKETKLLGVTATADRSDGAGLGQMFQSCAFKYGILDAINDGWLVDITQQFVSVRSLDFSHIRTTCGDLNEGDLAKVMESEENIQGVCQPTLEAIYGLAPKTLNAVPVPQWKEYLKALNKVPRRTIVFTVSVAQAEMCANIFLRAMDGVEWVCGETNKQKRADILTRFLTGETSMVVNCGVLCLDSQTEILTSDGWVGIDEMTYQHSVANWDDGKVFFAPPKFIVKRQRSQSERMVILETKNRSVRVTEDHRMLWSKRSSGLNWEIVHASDLVGKMGHLPISGLADPLSVEMPIPTKSRRLMCQRIASYAHSLRKRYGYEWELSITHAKTIISERDSMDYKHPSALTLEECELIGFWIGDGGVSNLSRGGLEYTLCQFLDCNKIVDRVDFLIKSCGIDCVKRTKDSRGQSRVVEWSLPRGTGFRQQKRSGLFHLEPYLNKSGSPLWWGLNEKQFDAFIAGYWMADGEHTNNTRPLNGLYRIHGAREHLFNLIQSIACVRGYRTSLIKRKNGGFWIWCLSMTKKKSHEMTKYTLQFEDGWKDERVWCVTSDTGNIITRRRGTVTVVGNTEGYDNPKVELISVARPTKSRSLYCQIIGRSTRTLPGIVDGIATAEERRKAIAESAKPYCRILDFVGNSGRHKMVSCVDALGGHVSEAASEAAKKKAVEGGRPVRIMITMSNAQIELERKKAEAAERARLEKEARRNHLLARADYSSRDVDAFGNPNGERVPFTSRVSKDGRAFSEKQCKVLRGAGCDPGKVGYRQGQAIIGKQIAKWQRERVA